MSLISLKLENIGLDASNNLIADQVRENLYLEYEEILPDFKNCVQKLEFLHDVYAFANASGEDIVFGIEEKQNDAKLSTSIHIAMRGLSIINIDSAQRKAEGKVSIKLQPPLIGIQTITTYYNSRSFYV